MNECWRAECTSPCKCQCWWQLSALMCAVFLNHVMKMVKGRQTLRGSAGGEIASNTNDELLKYIGPEFGHFHVWIVTLLVTMLHIKPYKIAHTVYRHFECRMYSVVLLSSQLSIACHVQSAKNIKNKLGCWLIFKYLPLC